MGLSTNGLGPQARRLGWSFGRGSSKPCGFFFRCLGRMFVLTFSSNVTLRCFSLRSSIYGEMFWAMLKTTVVVMDLLMNL